MPPVSQPATQPLQEGSRWRHFKPSSEEVAAWFKTVPLDEGMAHEDFIAGVVLIPASEKIKATKGDGRGTEERWEMTFTPYVRVDTRVTYFRKLAEARDLIAVIEPVKVPKSEKPAFENLHMPDGFWWHVAGANENAQRFLCCTMRVALYRLDDWFAPAPEPKSVRVVAEDLADAQHGPIEVVPPRAELRPVREGIATKQVVGSPDINGLAKAETGAIGRALGVAGILVVGTGIATAEDMAELRDGPQVSAATLPQGGAPEETSEQVNARLMTLQAVLKPHADQWQTFTAWWQERSQASGWARVDDAPIEVRRGMATKMEGLIAEAEAEPQDSGSAEGETGEPAGGSV